MIDRLMKIIEVRGKGAYRLHLRFSDGSEGEHDFADLVAKSGTMVQPLRDEAYFVRVFLEEGALTWPNGLDLDPTALYLKMQELKQLRITTAAA
jgi:hypothetical protein